MAKNSFNEEKKVTTKGTGAGNDKKTESQKPEKKNQKASETKPNLQEGNAVPGQKGPKGNAPNNPK